MGFLTWIFVKNIPKEKALDAVFGYTCANDVSARDLQFGDGQWTRGKSLDTLEACLGTKETCKEKEIFQKMEEAS